MASLFEVILLPSDRVASVQRLIRETEEVAQQDAQMREVMTLFGGLTPDQQQSLMQQFLQRQTSASASASAAPEQTRQAAVPPITDQYGVGLSMHGGPGQMYGASSFLSAPGNTSGTAFFQPSSNPHATTVYPPPPGVSFGAATFPYGPGAAAVAHPAQGHTSQIPWGPKLSYTFRGDGSKGDCSYELWIQEVVSLLATGQLSDLQLMFVICRSLQGLASDVLMYMSLHTTPRQCLRKFDNIFGNVLPNESMLERFWSSYQQDGESVAAWACRLEEMVSHVRSRDNNSFPRGSNAMLKAKFWSGLRDDKVKTGLRHLMDSNVEYDVILWTAGQIAMEAATETRSHQAIIVVEPQFAKLLDKLLAALEKLDLAAEARPKPPSRKYRQQRNFHNRNSEHPTTNPESGARPRINQQHQSNRTFRGQCWKCGQEGHPKSRCSLNSKKPSA